VAEDHLAVEGDETAELGGLGQGSLEQGFFGPGVADGAGDEAEVVLGDGFGRLSVKAQANFADGGQVPGEDEGVVSQDGRFRIGQPCA
jgi:hypothetical protein